MTMIRMENDPHEPWKAVPGYEGLYDVSSKGRIRRVHPPNYKHKETLYVVLKPVINRMGYYRITLSKNNNRINYSIHRLVAMAFIENPSNKPFINHKDGNKVNNTVENLEWCTPGENNIHAFETGLNRYHPEHLPLLRGEDNPKHILKENDVRKIRILLESGKYTQSEIGKMYGVSKYAIFDIKRGKSWKEVV
jgi:hypothetical protein